VDTGDSCATAGKHLYGIGRYDPVKIVFLGDLGVLSAAGGKYAFTCEYVTIFTNASTKFEIRLEGIGEIDRMLKALIQSLEGNHLTP
jgi:hypothetical protein